MGKEGSNMQENEAMLPFEILRYQEFSDKKFKITRHAVLMPSAFTAIRRISKSNNFGKEIQEGQYNCEDCPINTLYINQNIRLNSEFINAIIDNSPHECKACKGSCDVAIINDTFVCEGEDCYQVLCLNSHDPNCTHLHTVITQFPYNSDYPKFLYEMGNSNPLCEDQCIIAAYNAEKCPGVRIKDYKIKEED